jgi:hypothetical protein
VDIDEGVIKNNMNEYSFMTGRKNFFIIYLYMYSSRQLAQQFLDANERLKDATEILENLKQQYSEVLSKPQAKDYKREKNRIESIYRKRFQQRSEITGILSKRFEEIDDGIVFKVGRIVQIMPDFNIILFVKQRRLLPGMTNTVNEPYHIDDVPRFREIDDADAETDISIEDEEEDFPVTFGGRKRKPTKKRSNKRKSRRKSKRKI